MTGDQIATLGYLLLLGVVIGGWMVVAHRANLGRLAQQAAIWGFIFLGAIVAAGLWSDLRSTVAPRQSVMLDGSVIEVPQSVTGHFHLTLDVNGTPVRFIVDTGATDLVLSAEDARRAGIDVDRLIYSGRASTANGEVRTASVRLDEVALAGAVDRDLRAVVNGGEMRESLLGMSYLSRFERIEIAEGRLVLQR